METNDARPVRLDELLGREVLALNHRSVGRLEEFRAEKNGDHLTIAEYVLGATGLLERLGMAVGLLFGRKPNGGYIARADQIDISDAQRPRLTCPVADLRRQ
jgi:hypothetical protein